MKTDGRYILQTTPWSSYSESVRWALDLYKSPFVEIPCSNGIYPILSKDQHAFANPTEIMVFLYSQYCPHFRLFPTDRVLPMTVYLNQQFGPAVQVFHASLGYPEPSRFKSWSAVDRVLWPFISVLISRYYAVADPIGEIDAVFQNISEKLAISGVTAENLDTCGKYLAANCLSAADITFASHAAFVLLPQAKMGIQLMKLNNVKASQKLHIARWRSNLAGKYALLICERERKHIFATKADQSQHWVWDYISLPTLLIYIFSPLLALLVGPAKWVLLYWFMFIAFNVYGLVTFSRPTFNMIQEKVSYMKYLYSHRASEDFAKEKAQPDKERSIKTSLIGKNE